MRSNVKRGPGRGPGRWKRPGSNRHQLIYIGPSSTSDDGETRPCHLCDAGAMWEYGEFVLCNKHADDKTREQIDAGLIKPGKVPQGA